ncbi:MAG: hypothetical protein H7A23_21340 [Leptospiraceae bacterium]|nr:hypothetical protein [Leptospiraceae bacterium]MCP5497107.1 hypothetical protein [Leptospiraceae bacterium]
MEKEIINNKKSYGLKILIKYLAFLFGIWGLSCASITKGEFQEITIFSSPVKDAKISIYDLNNQYQLNARKGIAPYFVKLKTGGGYFTPAKYKVIVEAKGYKKKELILKSKVDWLWYSGNIFFGWFWGFLAIDPMSGAMYELEGMQNNNNFYITLEKKEK